MKTRPTRAAIVRAQQALLSRVLLDDDPARECWACGALPPGGIELERAHILAARDGGGVEPSNFFLLCATCHREQPDDAPRDEQVRWLLAHESDVARTWRLTASGARA